MKRLELPSVSDCEHPQIRSHICMRTDWSFWLCWGSEVDKQFMWELSRDAPGLHRFDLRETVQSGWVTWSIALKPHWTSTKPDIASWYFLVLLFIPCFPDNAQNPETFRKASWRLYWKDAEIRQRVGPCWTQGYPRFLLFFGCFFFMRWCLVFSHLFALICLSPMFFR